MYVLHYKQHFCLNWSNIFHCVHTYNTLEGEEKVPLSNAPPLEKIRAFAPFGVKVKVLSTDCKSKEAQQCSSIQKCKSIIDIT